jgi:cytochrome c-type biogenesis protein CcsB
MKYFKYLFSGAFMGILLMSFAFAIGYATFVENDYDAITARMLVYNAWWFEAILLLMVINFAGMIFTKRLYIKSKLNILVIHIALIIIIIGAGVTRYIGFEGRMHIRSGQTTNQFYSTDTYFNVYLTKGDDQLELYEKVILSPVRENLFNSTAQLAGTPFEVSIKKYMPNAVQNLVPVNNGSKFISIVAGTPSGRRELLLKEGESKNLSGVVISFGEASEADQVNIINRGDSLFIKSATSVVASHMESETDITYDANEYIPIDLMSVHTVENVSFVLKEFVKSGYLQYQQAVDETQRGSDIVHVDLNGQQVYLKKGVKEEFKVGDVTASVYLGNVNLELPFSLQLRHFDLERYPGSDSPSSFASDVIVIDEANAARFEYRIFMNNVLNYGGYRFFQSSYDQDEQGTILSVNHDFWGTMITYFGYALLFGSLIVSLFTKTRVHTITTQINEIHAERKKLGISAGMVLVFLLCGGLVYGQSTPATRGIDKDHAASFGRLLTQSQEGRIEPVNTFANEVLVKIYKKNKYNELNAEQVILGMALSPEHWQTEPLIKVTDDALISILSIQGDYARFADFLDEEGQYKLKEYVDRAYQKKPALRTTFDKEVIYVDERANVLYMILNNGYLNIFPVPDHPNDKWLNPSDFHQLKGHGTVEGDMFENYSRALQDAIITGDYSNATAALTVIQEYQNTYGANVMPSEAKVNMEIFYNEVNIFKRLFPFYFVVGILMVGIFFLNIFNPKLKFSLLKNVFTGIVAIAFVLQTLGLALRWYVSGHAPWSNGYESMIYIAWATVLAGFLFMKKSPVSLGVTAILAGITLLTAHMSWLNPEITNLVPVLKSYWLTIHVATITASYGFLALGCMMGFLNLILMIFRNNENKVRVNLMLKELTLIVELSLSIGLILLIIGNFLGGIWANESWGRYWGWDPKESWTLVTVIFYSFVLHMRLIPSIRSAFTFNFLSVIGFGCVLMTYFGVNYYLSGLHSYANGDPVPVPNGVYYTLVIIFAVGILAAINDFRMSKPELATAPAGSNGMPAGAKKEAQHEEVKAE